MFLEMYFAEIRGSEGSAVKRTSFFPKTFKEVIWEHLAKGTLASRFKMYYYQHLILLTYLSDDCRLITIIDSLALYDKINFTI